MTRDHIVPGGAVPTRAAVPEVTPTTPARRSIEQLLKRKPGAPVGAPLPLPAPGAGAASPSRGEDPRRAEESLLLRRLRERGELVARVAAPIVLERPSADPPTRDEAEGDSDDTFHAEADVAEEAEDEEETVAAGPAARCAELREAGLHEEAVRLARDGLARYADHPGVLLLELSRATFALGHHEEAIDSARDALFVWRCRESVEHLIWILTALHRFEPEDGVGLKRAALRHPHQPLLRHAAGVFEMSHGSRGSAEAELRAARALDPCPDQAAAIERDLVRLLGPAAARAARPA
jgi:hypothetical protein